MKKFPEILSKNATLFRMVNCIIASSESNFVGEFLSKTKTFYPEEIVRLKEI